MKEKTVMKNYAAPSVDVAEVAVESGIAASDTLRKPNSYETQEWSLTRE